ncbi:MAG: flavodoxin-dependent (E)-4-hydroxy-3-methylbut-2-enyl-diphosphate synthase [Elusimicrobia bacterium]|nr:flavodoxin-dependent (E)-4-hydroxy-3-methylbut-2-enyl-diphosphate synthase [Elusimicrobiota bacterium]
MSGPLAIGTASPVRVAGVVRPTREEAARVLALLEQRLKKDTPPEILDIELNGPADEAAFGEFRDALASETQRLSFWVTYRYGAVPKSIEPDADVYGYRSSGNADEHDLGVLMQACRNRASALLLRSSSVDELVRLVERLKSGRVPLLVSLEGPATRSVHGVRRLAAHLRRLNANVPIVLAWEGERSGLDAAVVLGALVCDGIGDVVRPAFGPLDDTLLNFSYNLLQACGNRITKTEFVSCPSCGRTLFDLQSTTERIKSKTGHLKGVKIAIMGCIVNGPGEMADADFGYVGGGPGKINLYVGKTCVEKSIPTEIADDKLIELIKSHGKWTEPPHT